MARIIECGLLPPDHPLFKQGLCLIGIRQPAPPPQSPTSEKAKENELASNSQPNRKSA
jgi:hypothetical protein